MYRVDWQADAAGNLVITRQDETDDAPRSLEDALEALTSNDAYEWLLPEDIGALTDAPILGYEVEHDDDGAVMYVERVYWYPQYETRDPLAELLEGRLVFTLAPSNDGSTYRHGMGLTPDERRLMQRIHDAVSVPLRPDDFNEQAQAVLEGLLEQRLIRVSDAPQAPRFSSYYITDKGRAALAEPEGKA